jgi:hypothetical protein
LALKRHEVPPPGYFDRFSRDVMARIKSGDTGDEIGVSHSWFSRFLRVFDVKPVFAGAFGTAVCAFLISGVISSEPTGAGAAMASGVGEGPVSGSMDPLRVAVNDPNTSSNTMESGSLFDQFKLHAAPVTVSDRYYYSGGN